MPSLSAKACQAALGRLLIAPGKRGTTGRMARRATAAAANDANGHLSDLRAVNLQLQATIDTLRGQLEQGKSEADAAVQRAQAVLADEISQLKATVQSMRDRLEAQMADGETAIQSVRAADDAEMKQLKATINTLRTELEAERIATEHRIEKLEADFARERETLQQQVQALRLELEKRA